MNENQIENAIAKAQNTLEKIRSEYARVVVGQENMLNRILIAMLCNGHILLEGVPGLAKTLAVKTVSTLSGLDFSRIQFTPDLLPADILGTQIYNQRTGKFSTKKGPLFTNIVLADEINRTPPKTQSALLEAMQENQITIADTTYHLEEPYFVLATQNPIEQEGTYPLPEAQIDRFMLKTRVEYPNRSEEKEIIKRMSTGSVPEAAGIIKKEDITAMRELIEQIYIDDRLYDYIVELIFATREPAKYDINPDYISNGASPRASIYLVKAAKANAFLQGDSYVKTDDIRAIAYDVLRHRIIISYEAEAEGLTSESIIRQVFEKVATP